jgi:hypothetical protein
MPNGQAQPQSTELEKKPLGNVDALIFSQWTEIIKVINDAAIKTEMGELNSLFLWRASLLQLYTNIRPFFTQQIEETAKISFERLDQLINVSNRSMATSQKNVAEAIGICRNLNQMFIHRFDELFVTFRIPITPKRYENEEEKTMGSEQNG